MFCPGGRKNSKRPFEVVMGAKWLCTLGAERLILIKPRHPCAVTAPTRFISGAFGWGPPVWASLSSDQLEVRGGLKGSKHWLKSREAMNFPDGILQREPSSSSPKGFRPFD